jgi:hypothetical protein
VVAWAGRFGRAVWQLSVAEGFGSVGVLCVQRGLFVCRQSEVYVAAMLEHDE